MLLVQSGQLHLTIRTILSFCGQLLGQRQRFKLNEMIRTKRGRKAVKWSPGGGEEIVRGKEGLKKKKNEVGQIPTG